MSRAATPQTVLSNIRAEIARNGTTQEAVAQHLGFGRLAMNRRLTGQVPLSVDELVRIAVHLRVHPARLLGLDVAAPQGTRPATA